MALGTITPVDVAGETFQSRWNVSVSNYKITSVDADGARTEKEVDFEALLVYVSTNRATTVEQEIRPVSTQVTNRNNQLSLLTTALSTLTSQQTLFDAENDGGKWSSDYSTKDSDRLTPAAKDAINKIFTDNGGSGSVITSSDGYVTKAQCEQAIQLVKSEMDRLNNESSSDMTRLQSLVDKRDESYSTASSLMSSVSDTRGNAIRNM